jgi:hypothetical protein
MPILFWLLGVPIRIVIILMLLGAASREALSLFLGEHLWPKKALFKKPSARLSRRPNQVLLGYKKSRSRLQPLRRPLQPKQPSKLS